MKKLQLSLVLLCAAVLTACSPRVAQPPPLDELEPPMDESAMSMAPEYDGDAIAEANPFTTDAYPPYEPQGDIPLGPRTGSGEWVEDPALETVYFGYDQFQLDEDATRTLARNAQYLQRNPNLR
ncbi:MAG: hypothetical protein KC978_06025, partial [Candidatus Omnitrophica bacterium]|nr:hypothetical protein [Candidatus Omnitrophota bacterium]